jgi:undecaprenyl-diphosphatase
MPVLQYTGRLIGHASTKASQRWIPYGKFTERYKAYAPVAAIVLVGGVLAFQAADGFVDLAELVRSNSDQLMAIDNNAHSWATQHRATGATGFFTVMTIIGGPPVLGATAFAVAVALYLKRRFRWLAYLAVTAGGGALLNVLLKLYFARARPAVAEMMRRAHGYSFPSGHAMGSTVVFLALSYLAFRTATQWRWKSAAIAGAATMILAVSLSRVYLGVHWISDVAAGMAGGTVWVGTVTIAYETLRRIRRLRQRPVNLSSMRDGARGA